MSLYIKQKSVNITADPKRVVARPSFNGNDLAKDVIRREMENTEEDVARRALYLLQDYSRRHRNITRDLDRRCSALKPLFAELNIDFKTLTVYRKLLIGSYFIHEYAIESAGFFNPSLVDDPNQVELQEGEKRMVICLRTIGEDHISSISFRRFVIDHLNNITILPAGNYISEAEIVRNAVYNKKLFFEKAYLHHINNDVLKELETKLDHHFEYSNLRKVIIDLQKSKASDVEKLEYDKVLWLADSYYEIVFSLDTDISDRVIFPISEYEQKGIEDARFVHFNSDDQYENDIYYAIYTAFDGTSTTPKLLQTSDFYNFNIMPLNGSGAQSKNLALFPRKINNQFVTISCTEGCHNFIMYSNEINVWENPKQIKQYDFKWLFLQTGHCGSPIEIKEGWLFITYGIDILHRCVLNVSLLDLEDPTVEISRLSDPLLIPEHDTHNNADNNWFYSCGSLIHNGVLIIPFGNSDSSVVFAEIDLNNLINMLKTDMNA